MSREIKFRGNDSFGNWHYGFYSKDYSGTAYITTLDGVSTTIVDEKTVSEYTGLKDKNGVEIYEGDVCRWVNLDTKISGIGDISYSGLVARFGISDGDCYYQLNPIAVQFEVIGNIHENPELLKQ